MMNRGTTEMGVYGGEERKERGQKMAVWRRGRWKKGNTEGQLRAPIETI